MILKKRNIEKSCTKCNNSKENVKKRKNNNHNKKKKAQKRTPQRHPTLKAGSKVVVVRENRVCFIYSALKNYEKLRKKNGANEASKKVKGNSRPIFKLGLNII